MNIVVNGTPTEIAGGTTIAALLEQLELTGRRIAVEVNGEIAPRSAHADHELRDGDRLEVIRAVGGG